MRQGKQTGQALIEFSLVLMLLVTLIFGTIGTLQVILTTYAVGHAARSAAHEAALIGGYDGPQGRVWRAAAQALDGGMATHSTKAMIEVTCRRLDGAITSTCRRYDLITITVVYRDQPWVPMPPFLGELQISASASRTSEQDAQR
jgi:Flp pilus assembly protein TadG